MERSDLSEVVRDLAATRASYSTADPPSSRLPDFSVADGYEVARLLRDHEGGGGLTPAGMKLGFTNQAVWTDLGLDSPFWAPLFETTLRRSPASEIGHVAVDGLVQPRIEPEIVVGLRRDLERGASTAEVATAIAWAALGFELVQCHYPDWNLRPADAIADAGLHGILVIGEPTDLDAAQAMSLSDLAVELAHDGAVVGSGTGANALGGPAAAVHWLLGLPGVEGLRAGTFVTTGSLTGAPSITAGETWEAAGKGPVVLASLRVQLDGNHD